MKKTVGHVVYVSRVCAAQGCGNDQRKSRHRFFKFPEDSARAKIWALACHTRVKPEYLNRHSLCETHFEERMFTNDLRKRLQPNAVPTLFSFPEESLTAVSKDHSYMPLQYHAPASVEMDSTSSNDQSVALEDKNDSESTENVVHAVQDTAPDQFPNVCRSCLRTYNLQPLFKLKYNGFSFQRIFESCTSVQVKEGDELPQNICFLCVNEVLRFYKFILKTQKCDMLLTAALNKRVDTKTDTTEEVTVVKHEAFDAADFEITDTRPNDVQIIKTNVENHDLETEIAVEDVNSIVQTNESAAKTLVIIKIPPNTHKTAEKRKNVRSYSCGSCRGTFPTIKLLMAHCTTEDHLKPKFHHCPTCRKGFNTASALGVHVVTHTNDRPFMCAVCGVRFSLKQALKKHMMIHTGEKAHLCEVCGKSFRRACNLTMHKMTHTGEKPQVCEFCGKAFIRKQNLMNHRRTHTVKTPYTCSHCKKRFSCDKKLSRHQQTHFEETHEQLFECKECGKTYAKQQSLHTHLRVHQDQPFRCKLCDKTFVNLQGLYVHMRTHTGERPHVCQECGKGFKQYTHLVYHTRTHTGEKPYSCTYCGKRFARSTNCQVHVRIHTGEKPYVCDVCKKGFYDSNNLKQHRKTHDRNE